MRSTVSTIVSIAFCILMITSFSCTLTGPEADIPEVDVIETPEPENQSPIIHSIVAPDKIDVLSSARITCIARDPEGDELSYYWSTDNVTMVDKGATIMWTAPESTGEYYIDVEVVDIHGASSADFVVINVTDIPNQPPVISSFIITAPLPRGKVTIEPAEELFMQPVVTGKSLTPVHIECIADDPDGDRLEYAWTATEGKITDEAGNSMVWIVPPNPVRHIITVTVNDSRGGTDTARLIIDADCCK